MNVPEPTRAQPNAPEFQKKHSATLRLWHWTNLIVLCGSLLTVLVNSTLFDRNWSEKAIHEIMGEKAAILGNEGIRELTHGLEDRVWEIHVYFGYGLAALLLFRLLLEYFQLADQRFIRQFRLIYRQYQTNRENWQARHDLAVRALYLVFYATITAMVCTGLTLAFEDALPFSRETLHSIKEFHGFCMYIIIAFVVLHVVGVFLAERKESPGIISDMVNGGQKQPLTKKSQI